MMVAQTNTPRLKTLFEESVVPKLKQEFGLTNLHQLPAIDKVIVNCGIGRFLENQKLKSEIRDTVYDTLSTITGQRPITLLARKSVSNFKVREGAPSAMMVTLRRDHMWHFLDRLINLAMPRIKDFQGNEGHLLRRGWQLWPRANGAGGLAGDQHGARELRSRHEYQHLSQSVESGEEPLPAS